MNFSVLSTGQGYFLQLPVRFKLPDNPIILQIMRIGIVSLVILSTSLQLIFAMPGKSQSIEQVQVNIEAKNESLIKVFQEIEAKSQFHFMYRNEDVKQFKNIHISSDNQSIATLLKAILSNTHLSFKQVDSRILITKVESETVVLPLTPNTLTDNNVLFNKTNFKGKVTDSKGGPLVGVTVSIKGTTQGTVTDINGNFELNIPDAGATLVFNYVEYSAQEINVSPSANNITVILNQNIS